jgi:NAD(P)-dependent dehydrogenase (short-subunit alcohol dehydrogenase family)
MGEGSVVVVGGTSGLGLELARHYAGRGREVVVTGREADRAATVAKDLGDRARGIGFDLARPGEIADACKDLGPVAHLVLCAIERDLNTVREYDLDRALRLVTLKLVGYTETVHALLPHLGEESSVVLFGGLAKDRPYPGSTTVSTVNGGVTGMVQTLAVELAPIRVNALHPGIVGDSPYWRGNEAALERTRARTPGGRLVRMQDIVGAAVFLLENQSVNGVNLAVDRGWLLT